MRRPLSAAGVGAACLGRPQVDPLAGCGPVKAHGSRGNLNSPPRDREPSSRRALLLVPPKFVCCCRPKFGAPSHFIVSIASGLGPHSFPTYHPEAS